MSLQTNVADLKQQLENLFPGKWVSSSQNRSKTLITGFPQIDQSPIRGLSRQRISEWTGPPSCGKTTVLRAITANWCASGLNVSYIDSDSRLSPSDWSSVTTGHCGAHPDNLPLLNIPSPTSGRFYVVRIPNTVVKEQKPHFCRRNTALWATDQLLRSELFDVVILDLGSCDTRQRSQKADRMAARLQRSLAHSKAGLIILRDNATAELGWGCHTRLNFEWGREFRCDYGANGIVRILPAVICSIWKDGISQPMELTLKSYVPNRLFTHPAVPDRRSPKT